MENNITQCMRIILNQDWTIENETKKVWEWIKQKKMTSAPAFKGKLYDEMPIKIMYVGHAVNGWDELDVSMCETCNDVINAIQSQENAFETWINEESEYKHISSKFLRLIKHVLELQNESDSPTNDETWYHDSKNWQEKIIWTNLYNVAPRYGYNPERQFIKLCMEQYTEMFRIQIIESEPDIVIVCPLRDYFIPWKRMKSFDEVLDSYQELKEGEVIIGKGKLGKSEVIVCKRPDYRGSSYKDVFNMAKCISQYIDDNCKKRCH